MSEACGDTLATASLREERTIQLFEQLEFLSGEECGRVMDTLNSLRDHWTHRHPSVPFYTLGAPSYLDAADLSAVDGYYRRARRENPLLAENFGWLYERLADVLSAALGAPCRYPDRFGLPGFHIFLPDNAFTSPFASVHIDLQYELLDWPLRPAPDFERPLSFTGSIVLPAAGAGVNVWDIEYVHTWSRLRTALSRAAHAVHPAFARHPPGALRVEGEAGLHGIDELSELTKKIKPRLHPYNTGGLVIHSGHSVHQIAPMPAKPGQTDSLARITLQGHAIRAGGIWRLYW